jgi:hypothetical protein
VPLPIDSRLEDIGHRRLVPQLAGNRRSGCFEFGNQLLQLLGSHPVLVEHAHELSDNDGTIGGLNRQPHERAFGVLSRLIVAAAQEQHERADPSRFGDRSAITPILRKCQQRAGRLFLRLPTRIAAEQINKWADGTGFSDDLGGWGLVGQSLDFADLLLSVTLSNISSRGGN